LPGDEHPLDLPGDEHPLGLRRPLADLQDLRAGIRGASADLGIVGTGTNPAVPFGTMIEEIS
jgi:hypothetical protein